MYVFIGMHLECLRKVNQKPVTVIVSGKRFDWWDRKVKKYEYTFAFFELCIIYTYKPIQNRNNGINKSKQHCYLIKKVFI